MPRLIFLEPTDIQKTLYPFSLLRDGVDMPIGLLSIREKWNLLLAQKSRRTQDRVITIRANLLPTESIAKQLNALTVGQSLYDAAGQWLALSGGVDQFPSRRKSTDRIVDEVASLINYPWDLLRVLDKAIAIDFILLTKSRRSQAIPKQIIVLGKHRVFIARGATVSTGVFNATAGPIYIGSGANVQEGAMIRGPFLLGDGAVVTMGAKVYGPTAIGSACMVGGEIKRSLLFPYSNKAHEGYMGDSVIGSWCNWGAGTSNSNIKNTAGAIRVVVAGKEVVVGQKCGVFMGDHTRTAINASLNSGTIVGVSAQIGTGVLTEKRIPSFRWVDGKRYRFEEATQHIRNWKALKGETLAPGEIEQLKRIYKSDK